MVHVYPNPKFRMSHNFHGILLKLDFDFNTSSERPLSKLSENQRYWTS